MPRAVARRVVLVAMLVVPGLAGCGPKAPLDSVQQRTEGLVVVLPGLEGDAVWNRRMAEALRDGGVRSAIVVRDWGIGLPGKQLANLYLRDRADAAARALAEDLAEFARVYPGRPVQVIANSSGAYVALRALEELGEGEGIDQLILLGAGVDPDYDLTLALLRVRQRSVAYVAPNDWVVLGVGSSALGMLDGSRGVGAGRYGFTGRASMSVSTRVIVEGEPAHDAAGGSGETILLPDSVLLAVVADPRVQQTQWYREVVAGGLVRPEEELAAITLARRQRLEGEQLVLISVLDGVSDAALLSEVLQQAYVALGGNGENGNGRATLMAAARRAAASPRRLGLTQLGWYPQMRAMGHVGMHTWVGYEFGYQELARYVRHAEVTGARAVGSTGGR